MVIDQLTSSDILENCEDKVSHKCDIDDDGCDHSPKSTCRFRGNICHWLVRVIIRHAQLLLRMNNSLRCEFNHVSTLSHPIILLPSPMNFLLSVLEQIAMTEQNFLLITVIITDRILK